MKKILSISLLILGLQSCIVSSNPNMDFLSNLGKPPEGVHIVAVNPPMFLAKPFIIQALKQDGENPEVIRLVRKIKEVRVMCVSTDTLSDNKAYHQTIARHIGRFLHEKNYEEYAVIHSDGQKIAIHALQQGDDIRELLIQTISPQDGDVYVYVKTKISPDELSKLINMAEDKKSG